MNDPFFDTKLCVERLFNQYLRTPELIIAVDFDETIFDFHNKGYKFPKIVEILKKCNDLNFHIIIFTSSKKERHEFILKYCEELEIKVTCINKNSIDSQFGNDGKIFYNLFLDDRAGLGQTYEILKLTIDKIKYQKSFDKLDK